MKIVGQQPNPLPETSSSREAASTARSRAGQTSSATSGEDRVDLSPLARTLATLRSEVGDVEAIDQGRVAELRQRLQSGTYDPPASEIADALLRELAANRLP